MNFDFKADLCKKETLQLLRSAFGDKVLYGATKFKLFRKFRRTCNSLGNHAHTGIACFNSNTGKPGPCSVHDNGGQAMHLPDNRGFR